MFFLRVSDILLPNINFQAIKVCVELIKVIIAGAVVTDQQKYFFQSLLAFTTKVCLHASPMLFE